MSDVRLSLEQQHAVDLCTDLTNRIVGVTGGAGVGKTLVLGEAYRETKEKTAKVCLCAPTGRAAKRIQELTGIPAKTVHRLLEFPMPDDMKGEDGAKIIPGEPKRNSENRLVDKVVYCDESSMLSPTLYKQLLAALPEGGAVRFFGDNNQLPPVESGTPPFIDVLERYPSATLTFNYRSNDDIVSNAQRILSGSLPVQNDRFRIIYTDNPVKTMLSMVGKEFMSDSHQIIMPARKGSAGTQRVNPSLQMRFNGKGDYMLLDRYDEEEAKLSVRAGDKYLWIKNDYQLKLFNGDIGRIDWIDDDEGSLGLLTAEHQEVLVPARVRQYDAYKGHMMNYDPRKQLELGYAVTTHKSQGSEFESVIYCMCAGHSWLLNRQNLYTAVTRAKKNLVIITDRKAMGQAMKKARR